AMRDLRFTILVNYTRQTSLFTNALNFNNNAIGPTVSVESSIPIILNPFGATPTVNGSVYNQYTGGGSVTKNFDNNTGSVALAATVYHIAFDNTGNLPLGSPF